ncbi:MAG: GNAT family N-acetyltransferase [bacterium]
MSPTIRNARAGDKDHCLALLEKLADAAGGTIDRRAGNVFDALDDGARGQVLIAEQASQILGMAAVSFNLAMRYGGEYCQLEELVVDPDARGRNIGGLLVEASLALARARGCREYGLYLVAATEQNLPFYQKYGFEKVGSELRQRLS